ncbi:MAG: hypothetical protein ACHQIM_21715, partial [Sphingobacteriales bacterium]
ADINDEIKEVLTELSNDPFSANGDSCMVSKLKIGAFIFTDIDKNTGKLEDILLPLMKHQNETNFEAAGTYLSKHHEDSRLFPLKLSVDAETSVVTESRSSKKGDKEKYDEKKSLLGVVGQLQRSGKSNVVCISDSDYLTLSKIQSSVKCQEIITFFDNFIKTRRMGI